MKVISTGMSDHLALANTALATFVKLKRTDDTIFTFSEYDRDITYDLGDGDGAQLYAANDAYTRSALKYKSNIGIDNFQITGQLDSSAITIADMRAGEWDDAEYHIFMLAFDESSLGDIPLGRGNLGKVITKDNEYQAEMLSMMNRYNTDLIDVYSPACRVDLGSTGFEGVGGCGVRVVPDAWSSGSTAAPRQRRDAKTGTVVRPTSFNDRYFMVDSVSSTLGSTFHLTSTTEPTWNLTTGSTTLEPFTSSSGSTGVIHWTAFKAEALLVTVSTVSTGSNDTFSITYTGDAASSHFSQGLVTWTSTADPNFDRKIEVLSFSTATNIVVLWAPMADTISTGVNLTMKMGCNKTLARCGEFDNVENFAGFPHIPGIDRLFLTPNLRTG